MRSSPAFMASKFWSTDGRQWYDVLGGLGKRRGWCPASWWSSWASVQAIPFSMSPRATANPPLTAARAMGPLGAPR